MLVLSYNPLKTVYKGLKGGKNGEKNNDGKWCVKPVVVNYKKLKYYY